MSIIIGKESGLTPEKVMAIVAKSQKAEQGFTGTAYATVDTKIIVWNYEAYQAIELPEEVNQKLLFQIKQSIEKKGSAYFSVKPRYGVSPNANNPTGLSGWRIEGPSI